MNAIEIDHLSKVYKGKKGARVQAIKELSLEVARGEIFGFLGPNGAGKSSTIKTLMGLVAPSAGSARIMGEPVTSVASRLQVGYLPENPAFYDYLTAEEYLNFVGRVFKMEQPALGEASERVLKLLELWDARKRPIRGYSKGMVQRLGLAQVLIHDPEVYILDEPMSGLDPIGRALVKEIILELKKRGKCVFFSTHITADVESVCDRVGIIIKGDLKRVERVESIMTQGLLGYQVRVRRREGGGTEEIYLEAANFPRFMAEAEGKGLEVLFVEPRRKDLEAFFLDIVRGTCS